MQTLLALIATALVCALARPPVATEVSPPAPSPQRQRTPAPQSDFLTAFILPHFLMPHDNGYEDSPRIPQPSQDLLDQEINIINHMDLQRIEPIPYDQYKRWVPQIPPNNVRKSLTNPFETDSLIYPHHEPVKVLAAAPLEVINNKLQKEYRAFKIKKSALIKEKQMNVVESKTDFALTPLDSGYFKDISPRTTTVEASERQRDYDAMEPRQIRQNPNWSKTKTLVSEDMDILRAGFTPDDGDGTAMPHHHIHVLETPAVAPSDSVYGIALLAAVGAAITMAIVGFVFGWYTLSRKAKAAADVDYPAYGVTGPTVDLTGDRKLAQSAHMYHYQHQKQQIIAMERNGMEHRNASVSDPESEEENEEGDYTVYECPGFATTGEMEVKNPLFKDEATPASPKCDAVKTTPRE